MLANSIKFCVDRLIVVLSRLDIYTWFWCRTNFWIGSFTTVLSSRVSEI